MTLPLRRTSDVALAREKARIAACVLGFDDSAQIGIATAASELARAVIEVGAGGQLSIEHTPGDPEQSGLAAAAALELIFRGRAERLVPEDASWDAVRTAERLADSLEVRREPSWPVVARFIKHPPPHTDVDLDALRAALHEDRAADAIAALVAQNRELAHLLRQLRRHEHDLERVNDQLRRANDLAQAANARLEALGRRKDELIATIAHDLRSPLSAVRGALDLLVEGAGGLLTAQQERFISIADRASQHIVELVNDVLDAALLDAGLLRLDLQPVNLAAALAETRSTIGFLAQKKGIELSLAVDDDLTVIADPSKLVQVIQNLLSNAVKFTDQGGRVSMHTEGVEDYVRITVADTGLGIAPARLSSLFDKFRRSQTRGTRGERGTGLGLSICRQLVELHGGSIEVKSEVGRGSTFMVTLPRT